MAGNGSETASKRHLNDGEEKEASTASESPSPPTPPLPHFTAPSCLSHYWKLPRELQHRIVALACGPPIIPRSRIVGRSVDCTATTLLLMRTSRFFYAQAAPLLYRHVRVSRPSMLHAFHQSIAARPSLGQLVRSLHIGSDEALPDDWFPIRESDCGTAGHIAFTLKLPDEIDSKDWTCCVEHEPDHVDDESEQAAQAFRQALVSASKALDVNLYRHNLDFSNNDISSNAWHIRVLEVQAAVELHSIELRRCALTTQKRAKAKKIDINSDQDLQVTFPRLEVATDAVAASVRASRGVFRVTRTQIWARILSSGSPADRFDHPLLFARSGFKWLALGPDDVIHRGRAVRNFSEAEEIADVFSMPHSSVVPVLAQDGRSVRPSTPGLPDPLNLQRLTTATVGGCLALARCVLSLTPHVRNLSLTGFLQRAVASERAPCQQPLQSLTLGPHTLRWNEALQLTHSTFGGLKKLRICGGLLVDEEIDSISGANGAPPHLEIISWAMGSKFDEDDHSEVVRAVRRLLDINAAAAEEVDVAAEASPSRKRRRGNAGDDFQLHAPQGKDNRGERAQHPREPSIGRSSLLIEAHLHPEEIATVLDAAPSKEVAEAWVKGKEMVGLRHRLQLFEHPDSCSSFINDWASEEAMQALYDGGITWWERCGGVAK